MNWSGSTADRADRLTREVLGLGRTPSSGDRLVPSRARTHRVAVGADGWTLVAFDRVDEWLVRDQDLHGVEREDLVRATLDGCGTYP